jgi:hypothetical protein
MRVRLRTALPILQMTLASALLWCDYLWQQSMLHRVHGSFGTLPTFKVLIGMNAPAGLLRALWFRHLPTPWDDILLIPIIGALWYWMALNIECWRNQRSVCVFHSLPLRLITDVSLVGIGALLSFVILDEFRHDALFSAWDIFLFGVSYGIFFIAWAGFLIVFFGRDLVLLFRSGRTIPLQSP